MNEADNLTKGSVHKDNFFIFHDDLVLITAKGTIKWRIQNGYLHRWLIPLNVLQDETPYADCNVDNIPEFMPLDNLLNHDILQSLRINSILSRYILYGEETDKE